MSFDIEVKDKLIADGLVTTTNFFIGPKVVIPVGAGPFTLLTETGGSGDELTQNDLDGYEQPSAQIIVIGDVRSIVRTKAAAIRNSLRKVRNISLSSVWYRQITADQQPFDFPLDSTGRPRVGFNISSIKRPS